MVVHIFIFTNWAVCNGRPSAVVFYNLFWDVSE